jgi:exopolysaccharide biosynthesis polyprenyl glycosylphosphotransferase
MYDVVQLSLDICGISVIWLGSIQARVLINPFLAHRVNASNSVSWSPPVIAVVLIWLAVSMRFGMYRTPERTTFSSIQLSAFENAFVLTMITALVTFFSRGFGQFLSRMFVPVMLPVAFVVLVASRYAALALAALAGKKWDTPLRVALVADWEKARQFMGNMKGAPGNSFRGLIVPEMDLTLAENSTIRVLGTTRQIAELINKERLDHVIVLNASLPSVELEHCSRVFKRMNMPVSCALDLTPEPSRVDVSHNYGLTFVELIPIQFTRRQLVIKRVFDVVLSVIALLALLPLFAVIALLIKATSPGSVLYKSRRIGRGGRQFTFLKFRSMYSDGDRRRVAAENEKSGHIFKIKNDPRVTPIGGWLRNYSLDELPQLINILAGEMSFVGPRPLPASDLEPDGMSKQYTAWSEGRAKVHPGLTGLWQVSGRSDLSFEDMVRLDLSYIQNWSLALDIRILLETPLLVLRGAGAY